MPTAQPRSWSARPSPDAAAKFFGQQGVAPRNDHTAWSPPAQPACDNPGDQLDLYLLHWRSGEPLHGVLQGFQALLEAGLIRYRGVSNFDMADMAELFALPGGQEVATNQVLYNLTRRGIEWDLFPDAQRRGLPLMAYSPIEQGRLLNHPVLIAIARRHHATPAQVALAWVLRQEQVIVIPKAGTVEHVQENHNALAIDLTTQDLTELDRAFLHRSRHSRWQCSSRRAPPLCRVALVAVRRSTLYSALFENRSLVALVAYGENSGSQSNRSIAAQKSGGYRVIVLV